MRRAVLFTAVLFLFFHGIPDKSRAAGPKDIFGLETGNTWTYQGMGKDGPHTMQDKVVATEFHMSRTVYVIERRENNVWTETQWLEKKPGKTMLWGGTADFDGPTYTMRFSTGLLQTWYPMRVGESRFTATVLTIKELPGNVFNASMAVHVIGKKQVALSFGTMTAYEIRRQMRVWGNGADKTATFIQWDVPYLGCAKYEDQDSVDKLVSFSIAGGSITQDTDRGTLIDKIAGPLASGCERNHHTPDSHPISLAFGAVR
jgi:hypothetical protein